MAEDTERESSNVPVIQNRNAFCFEFMAGIFTRNLRKQFSGVHLLNPPPTVPDESSLICCMNHPSWNDPMVGAFLHQLFFRSREAYGPIDEQALEGYPILKRVGLYGVSRGTFKGARGFLRDSLAILDRRNTIIWLTAQGQFVDVRVRPIQIDPGLGVLLKKSQSSVAVFPLAVEYTYGEEKLPEVFVNFGKPIELPESGTHTSESWKVACEAALEATQDELAKRVMAKETDEFETLLGGTAGVGGVYGLWQRVLAVMRGDKYDPRHGSLTS